MRRLARLPAAALLAALAACGGPRGDVASLGPASACPREGDAHACARRAEEEQAARFPDRVRREGDELVLRIGRQGLGFRDSPAGTGPAALRRFTFHDYLAGPGLYVLRVHYARGSDFLLVEEGSGTQHRAEGPPVVSPDGRRLATMGPAASGGGSAVTVWSAGPEGLAPEWRLPPRAGEAPWTVRAPVWLDARTLRLVRVTGDEDGLSEREQAIVVRREGAGWTVEG